MRRVLILVEGQTEERFVKDLLVSHFTDLDIALYPRILQTKTVRDGANFKGGMTNYIKAKNDITKLLKDTNAVIVTTMFDLYGLPKDFPEFANTTNKKCYDRAEAIEKALSQDINDSRFFPYLQIHEFEALLFSSTEQIARTLGATDKEIKLLNEIDQAFANPEFINEHPETCPSQRILKIYPQYRKVLYGTTILKRIGITKLREKCKHFNEWVTKIEQA